MAKTNSSSATPPANRPDWYLIGAAGCAVLVVLLQLVGLHMPLGGYHGFNEGFYFTHALTDSHRSLAEQIFRPLDLNNPPLYPMLLAAVLRAFGRTVAIGRAFGIALSVALVMLTFWVGRVLYNQKIGLLAAAMAAVAPGVMLTGRNMQVDTLMVVLTAAALGCYLKAVPKDDHRWAIAAGALFGASFITKLPAVLAVVALLLWRLWSQGRDFTWIARRSTWVTAVVAALVGVPWHLYSLVAKAGYSNSQSALAETGSWKGFEFLWKNVISEQFWMLAPILAVAALVGIGVLATKRSSADKLVLSFLAVYSVFFLFFNYHSYYLVAVLPFAALAGARAIWTLFAKTGRRVAVAVALALVVTLPFTLLVLSSKKWTMLRLDGAPAILERAGYQPDATALGESSVIDGRHGPAVGYYFERAGYPAPTLYSTSQSEIPSASGQRLVLLGDGLSDPLPGTRRIAPLRLTVGSPIVAGWMFRMQPSNIHYFTPGDVSAEYVGPAWWVGIDWQSIDDNAHVLFSVD